MNVAIFDLDGCLSNDRHRVELIPDWESYHKQLLNDRPANLETFRRHTHQHILFVTARPIEYHSATSQWINKNLAPLPESFEILMRPKGDGSPSPALKCRMVAEWLTHEPNAQIVAAYDDREDVVTAYRAEGYPARLLNLEFKVADQLRDMADTFDERHNMYGDSYLQFGKVAAALWPDGMKYQKEDDYNRLGVVVQIISKLCRYTHSPAGHRDSAHDMAVYAAILESLT